MSWLLVASGCLLLKKDKPFEVDVQLLDERDLQGTEMGDLGFDVDLYDERASWYLPAFLDDEGWGALLLADRVLRHDGQPGVVQVDVTELVWEHPEPITLAVVPSSEEGARTFVLGDEPGGLPEACTLTVSADTAPEAHAADLLACLHAWTEANGGPSDLFVEIEATTAVEDWQLSASYVFGTASPVEVTCTGQQVVDDELRDEAGNIDLERLELAGWVGAGDEGLALVAWENTWDAPDQPATAGGWSTTAVGPRTGAFLGVQVEVDPGVPSSVAFSGPPAPVTTFPASWVESSLASLEAPEGFVDACAVVVHDALPNEVWMQFALVGDGIYHTN